MTLVNCIESLETKKIGYVVSLWQTDTLYIVKDTDLKGLSEKLEIDYISDIDGYSYKDTLYKVITLYKVTKYLDENEADCVIDYLKRAGIDSFKEEVYEFTNTITSIRHGVKKNK